MFHYAPAAIADFLPIAALDRVVWHDTPHGEFIPDGEHVWRIWVEQALVFCAKRDAQLVGVVVAFLGHVEQHYILHKIFVAADWRGQGIGKNLLALLAETLERKRADCYLTVDPNNARAIALYEKFGFCERKLVRGYYRQHEDRLILTRPWLLFD
jgi:ribosomal protein S18 acetylase RimI-like enzyme